MNAAILFLLLAGFFMAVGAFTTFMWIKHQFSDHTATRDLIHRLRIRASIRRSITTRKSVQEGKPDRIADILDEAANELERLIK